MRRLLVFAWLAAAALAVALLLRPDDPGLVLIRQGSKQLEGSFNAFIIVLLALVLLLAALGRLLSTLLAMPREAEQYRLRRSHERSVTELQEAIQYLTEGRYGQALRRAERMHHNGHLPALSAMVAALAARSMRDPDKVDVWAERAETADKRLRSALWMCRAEAHIAVGDVEAAETALAEAQKNRGLHLALLRLQLKVKRRRNDWREVLQLARRLQKRGAILSTEADAIKTVAHIELLRECTTDAAAWLTLLMAVPKHERTRQLISAAVKQLMARPLLTKLGSDDALHALTWMQQALAEDPDAELIRSQLYEAYGHIGDGDLVARLTLCEQWLQQDPLNAPLLRTLGQICRSQQLWGKARYYLEESLRQEDRPETHWQLAELFNDINEPDSANQHYRLAAKAGNRLLVM